MKKLIFGIIPGFCLIFAVAYVYFSFAFAPAATAEKPTLRKTDYAPKALPVRANKLPREVMEALKSVGAAQDPPAANSATAWENAPRISAEDLVKKIAGPKETRPVVLYVGFKVLYDGAHIPGAIFAGPAGSPDGLARLKQTAQKIPKNKEVIIYCGCCPFNKCPNVQPAYLALSQMRFRRLEVLYLAQDLNHDWIEKGLPVEKTHQP